MSTRPRITTVRRAKFQEACRLLRELSDAGFDIYVSGSGSVNLMVGPSHDRDGRPLRESVLERELVPRMSGGDW